MASYQKSMFIFRRDLRLYDNSGLIEACRLSKNVIPCFIFDPRQIKDHPYRSLPALQFMCGSLIDLSNQINHNNGELHVYYGNPTDCIVKLIKEENIEAIFVNRDYTPFSIQRDRDIEKICKIYRIAFHQLSDLLLLEPENALKSDGKPYTVFTPFHNNAQKFFVPRPRRLNSPNFLPIKSEQSIEVICSKIELESGLRFSIPAGRKTALKILSQLEKYTDYNDTRDYPSKNGTTLLSAHHKFGTCSIREVYHRIAETLGDTHPLLRQLYWRDFFTHIGYHFPHVFSGSFRKIYDEIKWDNNTEYFQLWSEGKTGFPIVDAGMRELNESGYMHNRVRMIVSSFLVKDLRVDWRWGERYFAQHLVDYDPCVNNGNWQWASSTGCDTQPYFRIFNPWLQQKKFDNSCIYIHQWIPELRQYEPKIIHNWLNENAKSSYPAPIIDHQKQSMLTKLIFKKVMTKSERE